MNNDILITALSKNQKINAYFTILTNTAKNAQKSHGLNIISTTIFSRAMVAGILLGGNLKNKDDALLLKWNCTGPARSIVVETTGEGNIRGYIADNNLPFIETSYENNFLKAEPYIGFGDLNVSRYAFDGKQPYNSVVVIETGEIAEDISIYLNQSLQIESAIKIGFSINKDNEIEICGGIILMAMPGSTEEDIKQIHEAFDLIPSFTDELRKINDIQSAEEILKKMGLNIISSKNVQFKCTCNKDKIINVLKSLKKEEFVEYITEDGSIDVDCQYCGKKYSFHPSSLELKQ